MKPTVAVILAALVAGCLTDAENAGRPVDMGTAPANDNKLPMLNGTYGAQMKYCDSVRKNDWSVENRVEMALVHVKDNQIWWNEASFEITNITRSSKTIIAHIKGNYEDAVMEYDINIEPVANNRFILDGVEYFYCAKLPRPR